MLLKFEISKSFNLRVDSRKRGRGGENRKSFSGFSKSNETYSEVTSLHIVTYTVSLLCGPLRGVNMIVLQ